jgi:hypothetical protein
MDKKLFGNINIHRGNMTRGSAYVLYEKDGEIWIGYSDEFNGDMYPGGKYEDMVTALGSVKTYEDYGLAMHKFNKENHEYDNYSIYHKPLSEYLNLPSVSDEIDLNREYYTYWFSDYLFFLNLTGKLFTFQTAKKTSIVVNTGVIATFNFGKGEGVYNSDGVKNLKQYKED